MQQASVITLDPDIIKHRGNSKIFFLKLVFHAVQNSFHDVKNRNILLVDRDASFEFCHFEQIVNEVDRTQVIVECFVKELLWLALQMWLERYKKTILNISLVRRVVAKLL